MIEARGEGPNFVIIGAQKAASTALLHALRNHPDIWMPDQEDPFMRDPVFDSDRIADFRRRYRTVGRARSGLKCPDYLARPEVPARLAGLLENPRLIVIVRNPVDRAISAYFWHVRWGALPVVDPNEGLRRLLDGEYEQTDPTSAEILEWGLYHQHISTYLEHFDRSRILIIHDKDLRCDRGAVLAETFRFLGVESSVPEVGPTRTTNEGVYSLTRLRFLQLRNRLILRWTPDRSYYTIFKPKNPLARFCSNLVAAIDRWVLAPTIGNRRPFISDEIRNRLAQFYAHDSAQFQSLLGRTLDGWPSDNHLAKGDGRP